MFAPDDLFDLAQTGHAALFDGCSRAWEALRRLPDHVARTVRPALHHRAEGRAHIGPQVFIGEGTVVEDGACIQGPAIIGRHCLIRHNAYIRSGVIVGDHCLVGHACELKNAVLFHHCQVPHFNYVGDSILGHRAHLGAGVVLSNFKSLPGPITIDDGRQQHDTGLDKFGALLGDGAEIGCNAVLNPGSVIGRGSVIYPAISWRGYLPPRHLAKHHPTLEIVPLSPHSLTR
jgi:NDP-sugar pyrophosphorylase family protein